MIQPSVLAIIPARKGSERLPQKNIKNFCGRPLIEWTIESALNSKLITQTVVTSDDPAVLSMKNKFGQVRFMERPSELATKTATSADVVLHVMNSEKTAFDYILLLQPTSPLRTVEHIDQSIEMCINSKAEQLVSARKSQENLNFVLVQEAHDTYYLSEKVKEENCWVLNGAIYLANWKSFLAEKKFVTRKTQIFEMSFDTSIDIDTFEDWNRAEVFMKSRGK